MRTIQRFSFRENAEYKIAPEAPACASAAPPSSSFTPDMKCSVPWRRGVETLNTSLSRKSIMRCSSEKATGLLYAVYWCLFGALRLTASFEQWNPARMEVSLRLNYFPLPPLFTLSVPVFYRQGLHAYGLSAWSFTARINAIDENKQPVSFFLKPELVPKPLARGKLKNANPPAYFFLIEFKDFVPGLPDPVRLGARLAAMHQNSISLDGNFGFHLQTYDGARLQAVAPDKSWTSFFGKLVAEAYRQDAGTNGVWPELEIVHRRAQSHLIPRLIGALESDGRSVKPTLIHGDLWDGNISVDANIGDPWIFDSAVYYAHNEMEIGIWRAERHQLKAKQYRREYLRNYEASEPEDEWDDRNILYSAKTNFMHSACFAGSPARQSAFNDMVMLIQKYVPWEAGSEEWRQINHTQDGAILIAHFFICYYEQYQTVSYLWGYQAKKQTIKVDNINYGILENLHDALVRIRLPDVETILWTDALCINQVDVTEKIQQVSIMHHIYRKCSCCFMWLGEVNVDGDMGRTAIEQAAVALDLLRFVAGEAGGNLPPNLTNQEARICAGKALEAMMGTAWWSRIWTVQEGCLLPEGKFFWGPLEISRKTVYHAAKNMVDGRWPSHLPFRDIFSGGTTDPFAPAVLGWRGERHVTTGLPTWALDFMGPSGGKDQTSRVWSHAHFLLEFTADRGLPRLDRDNLTANDESLLYINKSYIDRILVRGDYVLEESENYKVSLADLEVVIGRWRELVRKFTEARLDALNLMGGLRQAAARGMMSAFDNLVEGELLSEGMRSVQGVNRRTEWKREMCKIQALFITESGYIGLGPPNMEESDEVWVLSGG
ncbi:hypothetical protein SCUP234_07548 [Seiridium cupressi]